MLKKIKAIRDNVESKKKMKNHEKQRPCGLLWCPTYHALQVQILTGSWTFLRSPRFPLELKWCIKLILSWNFSLLFVISLLSFEDLIQIHIFIIWNKATKFLNKIHTSLVLGSVARFVRFIGLMATFQSLWQQLVCPNLQHS